MFVALSILIPVYKTEPFLRRCLDSVLNQTMQELEIIIVNDGSPDGSQQIIEEYAARDARIKHVTQPNQGLGATRNAGIALATGKYLAFLDSDDWVEKDYYAAMYAEAVACDADVVISDYYVDFAESKTGRSHIFRHDDAMQTKEQYLLRLITGEIAGFSWNKLYRRALIEAHQLRFPLRDEFENVEDQYYSLRSIFLARTIAFTSRPGYHYVVQPNSIVQKYQHNLFQDRVELYRRNFQFLTEHGAATALCDALDYALLSGSYSCVVNECKPTNPHRLSQRLQLIQAIAREPNFAAHSRRRDLVKRLPRKSRLMLQLLRSRITLGAYLLGLANYHHARKHHLS